MHISITAFTIFGFRLDTDTDAATTTKSVREHNAIPIGPIDHAQIGTGLGPVVGGLGFGLRVLGLDALELSTYVGGDELTTAKVIALEIADALVHIFDLQFGGDGKR